ncbi:NAD(P)-dependent oxidoreductase [Streptomyces hokutonensis]|uniref:NAD(P)-dependent oxidoreductase n=1 Tax=Streptomyces hokutonensis TaxID=1306990 RepID=A0ABW6MMR0_9ACTN
MAVLGAGIMGRGIIKHLRQSGFGLRLYNRTASKLHGLGGAGEVICGSPAEAAEGADAVISIVADDVASRQVWLSDTGALWSMTPGSVAVEISTLSTGYAQEWECSVRKRGVSPVAAPVTGSRSGAEDGNLVIFAGGELDAIERALPLFSAIGQQVIRLGQIRDAVGFKLVYNMLCGTILVAAAEALTLAEFLTLDLGQVTDILAAHGWASGVAISKGKKMAAAEFDDVECAVKTITKDLRYALDTLPADPTVLPVSAHAQFQLSRACTKDMADMDMAVIKSVYRL